MTKTITPIVTKALILSGLKESVPSIKNSLKGFEYGQIDNIENGIEALKKLNTTSYDVVICHNKIKFISGWNLIKEMKTSDKIQNMPVVLLGDMPAPASDEEMKAYGLVKYLKAPTNEADLSFLINSTLQLFKTSGTAENKYTKAKAALIGVKSDQAVELYLELHSLTKKSLRSSLGLAEAYSQKGEEAKAEALVLDALKADTQNTSANLLQIKLLLKRQQLAEAQNAGLALLGPMVDSPFYHTRILNFYNELKILEASEHICRDAIKKDFKVPEFWNAMARLQFQKGRFEESLQTIQSSVQFFGPNVELLNIKGACMRKLNRLDEAITAYSDALKISPLDPKVYFNMAVCCIAMKAIPEAKNHLEMVLKISPDFPNARAKLQEVEKFLNGAA